MFVFFIDFLILLRLKCSWTKSEEIAVIFCKLFYDEEYTLVVQFLMILKGKVFNRFLLDIYLWRCS